MASKQVQDLLVRLRIDGLEGLDSLKGAFRELAKTIGPTEQTIERARQSIIEFGEAGNKSEQLIKGQIEAFKGLRSQATQGGKVYKELTANIKELEGAAYGASAAVEAQRKALTALGLSANATASQIEQAINSLTDLRSEVRVDSQAFDNFGKSIAELTNRFRAVNQEAQNFAQAQQRIARPIGATSAAAKQQIRDLDLVTESLREQRDFLGALEGEERIKAGAAGLAERGAPAAGRRTFEEVVSESAFGGDIKKLLPAKDIKAALDEVAREIADFQQQIETKLSRKIQISFQETARAGRESARAMAAAFSDPELINVFNQFDKRLGELPDTTTGLNQELSELSQRLANTRRNTVDYLVVAMQMAGVQRELTAVTQGYAQSLLMGIRTGTTEPSARNLREVITALRAEMDQLDVTTSEGARAYAENAREARALENRLKGLADAYRHVGDMAAQAATAETSAATARITANYLNRPLIRQQEQAMAELGQRVRAGVAATPLALPAAGQTSAPGTGLDISGGARAGRPSSGISRFFTRADVGDAQLQMPGAPQAFGPQATEQQSDRARRAAISEAEAVRTAAEARQQAEQQIQSYRAEIDRARRADIGSIDSTQRLREAIGQYRSTLPGASAEFKKLTKELGELDARSEKLGRGLGRRRMSGMQMAQAAGAAVSGGIFGGPEGFLGGAIGGAIGGVGGAFAGAAAGAQVGALRQQLGEFADYAAQIQKMEIALKNTAGSQDQFNQAMAAASAATRDLNVPQDVAIQGMTKLTAAVKGAGGQVTDAELVFRNITAAIKGTGGSAEDVEGAITAMVQVFSKGKVSAEELSGQLGERLPGAVTKFAEANDMTLPELQKALEQGQVGLNELMNFIVQLGGEYAGVAERIAGSSQDAGARLTVAFNDMKIAIGETLQPIGAQFQEAFAEFIEKITPALVAVLPKIGQALLIVVKNLDLLAVAAGAAFAVFGASQLAAIGGIGGALLKLAAAAGTAYGALQTLNTAAFLNPWTALAAGVAVVGVSLYNTWREQEQFNQLLREAPLEEINSKIDQLRQRISDLGVESRSASAGMSMFGGSVGFASAEAAKLKQDLDELISRQRELALYASVGVTPRAGYAGPGFAAPPAQAKPSTFPTFASDKAGRSKAGKERESQLPQLMAELAVRRQISQIDERINAAQLMDNQMLQIRLEGEKQLIELAGRYNAIKFEKIPDDEKEVKRLLVMEDIEKARVDIAQKLAVANREYLKTTSQGAKDLKDSYEDQILAVGRLEELTSTGMTEALAEQYIQIEKIIDKEKEQYEARIKQLLEIRELGGPGADQAETDIESLRERISGLGTRESELKGLAGAAQPEQKNKIQEFIESAQAELQDLEALAVRVSQNIGNAVGNSLSEGISGLIEGTTTAKEVFANFLKDVGKILVQEGAKMIATYIAIGLAKAFAGLLGGGSSVVQGKDVPISQMPAGMAFANGAAFAQNGIQPFANGGIVTKPTFFKFANGGAMGTGGNDSIPFQMGVMGEAGPEAIMPLSRGSDGRLGVTASIPFTKSSSRMAAESADQETIAALNNPQPIDVRFESQVINNVEYVTAEQYRKGMAQAAQQGRALTLASLQNSVKTRKRVGMS